MFPDVLRYQSLYSSQLPRGWGTVTLVFHARKRRRTCQRSPSWKVVALASAPSRLSLETTANQGTVVRTQESSGNEGCEEGKTQMPGAAEEELSRRRVFRG